MKKLVALIFLLPSLVYSQEKKELDHDAYNIWRGIEKQLISNNGAFIAYTLKPNGFGNESLMLHDFDGGVTLEHDRAYSPHFTNNSEFLIFKVSLDFDEKRYLKRKKTKEEDIPGDTLAVYSLSEKSMTKIAGLKSFRVPKKWDDYLVYTFEPAPYTTIKKEKKIIK